MKQESVKNEDLGAYGDGYDYPPSCTGQDIIEIWCLAVLSGFAPALGFLFYQTVMK